jgi:membrane protein
LSLALETGLFAMIYKIMPRAHIAWHDVWVGAAVTAVLFEIGKFLIGLYLGKSGVTSGFGAAGSLVVLLLWVYYSAQIFLLGAEFTWIYAHQHGSRAGAQQPARAPVRPSRSGDAEAETATAMAPKGPPSSRPPKLRQNRLQVRPWLHRQAVGDLRRPHLQRDPRTLPVAALPSSSDTPTAV